jgi:hypothetical protein
METKVRRGTAWFSITIGLIMAGFLALNYHFHGFEIAVLVGQTLIVVALMTIKFNQTE